MQELKIVCHCGQKYKFDVEPVNGHMPFTVKCPICNLDGTARANDLLAQQFAVPPKPPQATHVAPPPPITLTPIGFTPPPPPRPVTAAPMPVGFTPPPPPLIAPATAGLSMNRATAPVAAAIPPLAAAGSGMAPPPITGRPSVQMQQQMKAKASGQFNLGLGIAGGVAGALVGCGLMYAFWYFVHIRFPIMGVAVGACGGYGARLLARGTDTTLGIITAVVAGASVAGTFVLMYGDFMILNIVSIVICAGVAYRASAG